MEKSRKPVSLASIRGFLRSYSAAILSPSLARPWGRVFRFSAEIGIRDYIINIHVTPFVVEGSSPLPPLAWRRTRYTSTVLTCARYLCRGNRARLFSARSRVLYMAGTISAFVPNVPRAFPLISFPFVLPWPLPLFEASSRMYVATARGIKYNKDIQWELIGYLRIYRSLRAALLRRGPVTARALLSFLPARSSPPLLPPLLRSLLFVFHLFAGRAAGSNGDIPRWNNIEPRF